MFICVRVSINIVNFINILGSLSSEYKIGLSYGMLRRLVSEVLAASVTSMKYFTD